MPRRKKFGKDLPPAASKGSFDDGPRGKKVLKERRGSGRRVEDDTAATARAPRPKKARGGKRGAPSPPSEPQGPVRVKLLDSITVGDLAQRLGVGAAEVVKDLMKMGTLASITQSIDVETAAKIARGFGAEVTIGDNVDDEVKTMLGVIEEEEDPSLLIKRPPVVTIMGHVDHGKTSLLDSLRTSNVASGEAGGITQHIGAYQVSLEDGASITFIDTPGHAAFSEMRARGANITDIVVLVVAADDGVKEQTIQSIKAAKASNVPIVVAINKIDKPTADSSKVKTQLLEHEIVLEDFGGEVLSTEVSAKTGVGLKDLLEQLNLLAETLDLKANPSRAAAGVVVEAKQVVGQGAVATALVQKGTLKVGDIVVAGSQWGRVRALGDVHGVRVDSATPSTAVEVIGLNGLPAAGDQIMVVDDETKAREVAGVRQALDREKRASMLFASRSTADRALFLGGLKEGELPTKLIDLVVKADVQGSAEALSSSLSALEASDDKLCVRTRVLRSGAGLVTNEDIMLASVSNAIIYAFGVPISQQTRDEALKANVEIRSFSIVYDAIDDVQREMAALIRPPPSKQLGTICGTLDVKQIFKIGAVGKVAGCSILDGFVRVGNNIRILRGNIVVYEGKLQSLRSVKDAVDQVNAPNDCGISFNDYQGMEVDDRVEAYLPSDADAVFESYGAQKGKA